MGGDRRWKDLFHAYTPVMIHDDNVQVRHASRAVVSTYDVASKAAEDLIGLKSKKRLTLDFLQSM